MFHVKPPPDCYPDPDLLSKVRALLAEDNLALSDGDVDRLASHVSLIKQMNHVVGVVSKGDVEHLWERHVVDSISLAPVIKRLGLERGRLLDIGSGGGFPAVPIAVLLPTLHVTMLERSERKAGFLRKVVGAVSLYNATILCTSLEKHPSNDFANLITARAVDRPEKLTPGLAKRIEVQSVLLDQLELNRYLSGISTRQVLDQWTSLGLRRGALTVVKKNERSYRENL